MLELATSTWGSGARSVLLLHGLTSSAESWWRVAPVLADLGFRVVAPDLRGHGASPHADDYRISSYAADLVSLGDHWNAVIGHSLGGTVALAAYSPGWADRLILEDPGLVMIDRDEAARWFTDESQLKASPAAVRATYPMWDQGDVLAKAVALDLCDPRVGSATREHNPDWDYVPHLSRVDVPTLLLGADPALDSLVIPALGRPLATANPNVTFQTVAGAGHSIHRDSFDTFMDLISGFLEA